MRIAYVSTYQGPGLVKQRPTILNRSLANSAKLELISRALQNTGHNVEIISQGEVVENQCKIYPSFNEPEPFDKQIPIFYASAFPFRRLNALWSSLWTLWIFRARHKIDPFSVAIIWNLKHPQMACAVYAIRRMKIPVILQYEDDAFVSVSGEAMRHSLFHRLCIMKILDKISAGVACSPHLLNQLPVSIPKLLLRGVVGQDIEAYSQYSMSKENMVLFSGTHAKQYGILPLIEAWEQAALAGWELHITGDGPETVVIKKVAEKKRSIVFHGLVNREKLVQLMCSAKICINPHELSLTPGNVFAFKIVEYLAAGAHVVTTPMGSLERELEAGISYMADNSSETIAATLKQVIENRKWKHRATDHVRGIYGPTAVSKSLDALLKRVVNGCSKK